MSSEPHILIVEDDREIRALMARLLKSNEFRVTAVGDGREMDRALVDSRIDLIILDVMLPNEDGLSICRRVRAQRQVPIIMVSAKGEEVDRVLGLEIGADDYLVKPFASRELLARVRAVLRRAAGPTDLAPSNAANLFRFHGWTLDALRRTLTDPSGRVSP